MNARKASKAREGLYYCLAFLLAFMALFALNQLISGPRRVGGPYYYLDARWKYLPPRLSDEVDKNTAQTHRAYVEAYFNGKGRVIAYTKYCAER